MELSPSDKRRIEHQFDSFCKLVLVCEMKDYKKMILRKMAKEILFSELILIYGYDLEHKKAGQEEIKDIFSIKVMGFNITIKNIVGSFVKLKSILLNPAVLSVVVWNIEDNSFPFISIFPKVSGLLYSTPNINTKPISNKIIVDVITSLE